MPIFRGKTSTQAYSVSMYHVMLGLCGEYICLDRLFSFFSIGASFDAQLWNGSQDVGICSELACIGFGITSRIPSVYFWELGWLICFCYNWNQTFL